MNTPDLNTATWRKSTHSGVNSNCVEVANLNNTIAVRDSKHPTGPTLIFTPTEWEAFINGAKDGEFDLTQP